MATPTPEVDIPETSDVRMVCYACLGSRWERALSQIDWHCGDCGHHKALVISADRLATLKAEREAAR